MKLIELLKGPKPLANVKLEKFNTKLSCLVHIRCRETRREVVGNIVSTKQEQINMSMVVTIMVLVPW